MNLSLIWNRYLWLPFETWNQGVRGGPFPWTPKSLGVRPLPQPSKEISVREALQQAPTINSPAFSQKYCGAWEMFCGAFWGVGSNVLRWILVRRSSNRHQQQQGREPRSLTTQPPDIRTDASTGSSHQNPHQRSPTTKDQQLSNKDWHKQPKNRTRQTMVIVSPPITQLAPEFTKKSPTTDHSLNNLNQNCLWTFTMT